MEEFENVYKSLQFLFLSFFLSFAYLFFIGGVDATDVMINKSTSDGIRSSINNGNDIVTLNNSIYTGSNNTNITINSGRNITQGVVILTIKQLSTVKIHGPLLIMKI